MLQIVAKKNVMDIIVLVLLAILLLFCIFLYERQKRIERGIEENNKNVTTVSFWQIELEKEIKRKKNSLNQKKTIDFFFVAKEEEVSKVEQFYINNIDPTRIVTQTKGRETAVSVGVPTIKVGGTEINREELSHAKISDSHKLLNIQSHIMGKEEVLIGLESYSQINYDSIADSDIKNNILKDIKEKIIDQSKTILINDFFTITEDKINDTDSIKFSLKSTINGNSSESISIMFYTSVAKKAVTNQFNQITNKNKKIEINIWGKIVQTKDMLSTDSDSVEIQILPYAIYI